MASVLQIASPDAIRRIQRVQTVTIAWMSVEAAVSLFAAWRARSPALLAFGGDSAIELFSAVVVLWRFHAGAAHEHAEKRAARVAGALLFTLAAYVAITTVASLLGYREPKPTLLGIAILVAAAAETAANYKDLMWCQPKSLTKRNFFQFLWQFVEHIEDVFMR